jgi:hypothetical protein
MSSKVVDYLIWVTEIVARNFFDGNKQLAYLSLRSSGVWDLYSSTYDTTHTLGSQYILDEIAEIFIAKGVRTC